MKLNNKGFAISGVLYSLLILFVTLFVGILTILASTKFSFDKVKKDIMNRLEGNKNIEIVLDYSTYEIETGKVASIDYMEGVTVVNNGDVIESGVTYELSPAFNLNVPGTYKIVYSVLVNGKQLKKERTVIVKTLSSINYAYTGGVQNYKVDKPGLYKLEAWGAQGGYRSATTYGGLGGYATGEVNLKSGDTLNVYVGGAGGTGTAGCGLAICSGGFNGGGYRNKYYGGGGASDIRINNTSLYSRVLVAGGGGSDGGASKKGMYGGGSEGGTSTESYTALGSYCGQGGKQTYSGYSSAYTIASQTITGLTSNTLENYAGGFGFGGGGTFLSSGYGGAGGGGWYGGSGNIPDGSGDDDRGGGGGSGWIYTEASYTTWSSANTSETSKWLLNKAYYLNNASLISGVTTMPNPNGGSMTGNSGNGYIKITPYFIKY